jgi:hypothetical protein
MDWMSMRREMKKKKKKIGIRQRAGTKLEIGRRNILIWISGRLDWKEELVFKI